MLACLGCTTYLLNVKCCFRSASTHELIINKVVERDDRFIYPESLVNLQGLMFDEILARIQETSLVFIRIIHLGANASTVSLPLDPEF